MLELKIERELVGKCGIYCGACRLYILGVCKGCIEINREEQKCPYYKCVAARNINFCGECQEFPCKLHYGSLAVYAKKFLDWKKREVSKLSA